MRTTVDINDDLMRELKELARERGVSLTTVVNQVLQSGLSPGVKPGPFTQQSYPLGERPGVNFHKAIDLAAEMETDYTVGKLELGK